MIRKARLLISLPPERVEDLRGDGIAARAGDIVELGERFTFPDDMPGSLVYRVAKDGRIHYEADAYDTELQIIEDGDDDGLDADPLPIIAAAPASPTMPDTAGDANLRRTPPRTTASGLVRAASAILGMLALAFAVPGGDVLLTQGWHDSVAFGTATMLALAIDLLSASVLARYPLSVGFFRARASGR